MGVDKGGYEALLVHHGMARTDVEGQGKVTGADKRYYVRLSQYIKVCSGQRGQGEEEEGRQYKEGKQRRYLQFDPFRLTI